MAMKWVTANSCYPLITVVVCQDVACNICIIAPFDFRLLALITANYCLIQRVIALCLFGNDVWFAETIYIPAVN